MNFESKIRIFAASLLLVGVLLALVGYTDLSRTYCSLLAPEICVHPYFLDGFLFFSSGAATIVAAVRLMLPSSGSGQASAAASLQTTRRQTPKSLSAYLHKQVLGIGLILLIIGIALLELPHDLTEAYVAVISTLIGLGLISMEPVNAYEKWRAENARE